MPTDVDYERFAEGDAEALRQKIAQFFSVEVDFPDCSVAPAVVYEPLGWGQRHQVLGGLVMSLQILPPYLWKSVGISAIHLISGSRGSALGHTRSREIYVPPDRHILLHEIGHMVHWRIIDIAGLSKGWDQVATLPYGFYRQHPEISDYSEHVYRNGFFWQHANSNLGEDSATYFHMALNNYPEFIGYCARHPLIERKWQIYRKFLTAPCGDEMGDEYWEYLKNDWIDVRYWTIRKNNRAPFRKPALPPMAKTPIVPAPRPNSQSLIARFLDFFR